MVSWFTDAGLDVGLLPPAANPLSAFRFASDLTRAYTIDGVDYTLGVEEVSADERRVVREVICSYTLGRPRRTKMAELVYVRPRQRGSASVWGSERWEQRISPVAAPPGTEHRVQVDALVEEFSSGYVAHDRALPPDAIRRAFYVLLERCDAVVLRAVGGVYFVTHDHLATAQGMASVAEALGLPSSFALVPVPDTASQRVMVDRALLVEIQRLCRRVRTHEEAMALLDRLVRHQRALPASDVTAAVEVVEQVLDATKSD